MIIQCTACNTVLNKKLNNTNKHSFCSKKCYSIYKKQLISPEDRMVKRFIKSTWTNINVRCGKYKPKYFVRKNKSYANIKVLFSRQEYMKWCWDNKQKILTLETPSIDRLDSNLHYSLDNIDIIELSENIRKRRIGNTYINGPKTNKLRGVSLSRNSKFRSRLFIKGREIYSKSFDNIVDAYLDFHETYKTFHGVEPFCISEIYKVYSTGTN